MGDRYYGTLRQFRVNGSRLGRTAFLAPESAKFQPATIGVRFNLNKGLSGVWMKFSVARDDEASVADSMTSTAERKRGTHFIAPLAPARGFPA